MKDKFKKELKANLEAYQATEKQRKEKWMMD